MGKGRTEVAPVEFPLGNPVQLGREVGDRERQRSEVGGQMSEIGKAGWMLSILADELVSWWEDEKGTQDRR